MKVETPQLRWHQEMNPTSKKDQGANGPIRSCSLLTINENMGVLATAGNTEVNLWRVGFTADEARFSSSSSSSSSSSGTTSSATAQDGACDNNNKMEGTSQQPSSHILVQPQTKTTATTTTQHKMTEHTQIEHIVTLSRGTNERSINAVKFSPSGQHLVGAGDNGTVVVWTIPPPPSTTSTSSSSSNNLFNWSRIEKDADLPMRIIPNHTDDVMDVAWSSDSKRFTVCSLDHTLNVWELVAAGDWKKVHGSDKDHTHYIQGVAYDPKGVYLASMGSDRMVKVYTRKVVKESVIKGELAKYDIDKSIAEEEEENGSSNTTTDEEAKQGKGEQVDKKKKQQHAIVQSKILPEVLAESSFKLQTKGVKTLKFLSAPTSTKAASATTTKSSSPSNAESNEKDGGAKENTGNTKRHHMFADELTLGSFFRRLSFTTDGAFLVVPAAMWHGRSSSTDTTALKEGGPTSPTSVDAMNKLNESSFATYLFARHHFDQPYKVLTGLDKPSVVVRPNPVLFQLPSNSTTTNATAILPHRSIFAVLTSDTVLIYDTHHNQPLAMASGLHFAPLTDAAWSNDGKTLFVTSSDGYISILSFGKGELGEVYEAPAVKVVEKIVVDAANVSEAAEQKEDDNSASVTHQPKSNDVAVINTLVPKKKKKNIAETSGSTEATANEENSGEKKSVSFDNPLDDRSNQPEASQPVVINTLVPKKKKKKVATTLVTEPAAQTESTQSSGSEEKVKDSIVEQKRVAEEEPIVNILVAKKKQKVDGSSTPVTTM